MEWKSSQHWSPDWDEGKIHLVGMTSKLSENKPQTLINGQPLTCSYLFKLIDSLIILKLLQ